MRQKICAPVFCHRTEAPEGTRRITMDELTTRNEVLMAMTVHELPALAVDHHIAVQTQAQVPLSRITALGVG